MGELPLRELHLGRYIWESCIWGGKSGRVASGGVEFGGVASEGVAAGLAASWGVAPGVVTSRGVASGVAASGKVHLVWAGHIKTN